MFILKLKIYQPSQYNLKLSLDGSGIGAALSTATSTEFKDFNQSENNIDSNNNKSSKLINSIQKIGEKTIVEE